MLLASATPACCTTFGAFVGLTASAATPGPYEDRGPWSNEGFTRDAFLRQVNVRVDESVLVSRVGKPQLRGVYRGLDPKADPGPGPTTTLLLEVDGNTEHVPLTEVRAVSVETLGYGWLWGGLAGAFYDGVLYLLMSTRVG